MAKPTKKRGRLTFDKEKAKKSVQPGLVDMAAAIGGGAAGAGASQIHPVVPLVGGVALIYAGNYSDKPWMRAAGTGMLVATAHGAVFPNGAKTATKPTFKDKLNNGKDQAINFLKSFGNVFKFKKSNPPEKTLAEGGELGNVADEDFAALDQLERSVLASAMDYQNSLPSPAGIDQLETSYLQSQEPYSESGVDFDLI